VEPWSLWPLVDALLVLFIIFFATVAGFMISSLPTLKATLATKAVVVILAGTSVYGRFLC